jgi:threonine synthase
MNRRNNDAIRQTVLTCSNCRLQEAFEHGSWHCPACGAPLDWKPEPGDPRPTVDPVCSGPARYAAALPPATSWISLGDCPTPVADITIDSKRIKLKLDSLKPTGSFKDRGTQLLVSALLALEPQRLVEDSSGNAASSLAGFATKAGIACTVYAPATASPGKLVQARIYGADVVPVAGSRADVADAAVNEHGPANGVYYASHNWHPFFVAGVGVWLLEAWEQFGGQLPRNIVLPTGSGSALLGACLMLEWLQARNEIGEMPRLWAAQPTACCPIVRSWDRGQGQVDAVDPQKSIAEGTAIADPVRGSQLLQAIRKTRGGAVSVSESEILQGLSLAARQGVYMEPTSAVAIAAARKILLQEDGRGDNHMLLLITGNGLKSTELIAKLVTDHSL